MDPATKSAALRKLFGDPHFNQMDGLDTYIDDYTKEDPIPPAMLRAMNQARSLGLFDDEEKEQEKTAADTTAAPAAVASVEGPAPAAAERPQPATELPNRGRRGAATGHTPKIRPGLTWRSTGRR